MNKVSISITPLGLKRTEAAAYVGVGTTKFDELVAEGLMPPPRCAGSRRLWDRTELDHAFRDLPQPETVKRENPWNHLL